MAKVPDTNTFSLSTVLAITGGTSLSAAFTNAQARYFDSAYEGDHTSLLNFRNYGFLESTVGYSSAYLSDIRAISSTSWATVRGASSGTLGSDSLFKTRAYQNSGGTSWEISRFFMAFDLTALSGKTAVDIELRVGRVSKVGSPGLKILRATQSNPITDLDYNNFTFSDYIISGSITEEDNEYTGIPYYVKGVASSTERSTIQTNYFGTLFKIVLVETYDNANNQPSAGSDLCWNFWKSGEITGSPIVTLPELYVRYR